MFLDQKAFCFHVKEALKGKDSVFTERTDAASAEQYFQVQNSFQRPHKHAIHCQERAKLAIGIFHLIFKSLSINVSIFFGLFWFPCGKIYRTINNIFLFASNFYKSGEGEAGRLCF